MAKPQSPLPVDPASLPYRPCAGIMLINDAGRVFVARRIDTPGDAWQMPQGGIDPGEDPAAAALRELEEETGTRAATILAEAPEWIRYDLPPDLVGRIWKGRYRGQTQKWFLMRFTGRDQDIRLDTEHAEFDAWQWAAFEDVPRLIVPFKRAVYEQVCATFADAVAAIRRPASPGPAA